MKVLLVNPQFPNTYWSFRHALWFEGKRAAFPPLGLLTVSAMLPESWERRLIDMNIQPLKTRDIEWADIVLATGMLVQKDALRQVVDRCRARGKRVAIGGPYVTTTARICLWPITSSSARRRPRCRSSFGISSTGRLSRNIGRPSGRRSS